MKLVRMVNVVVNMVTVVPSISIVNLDVNLNLVSVSHLPKKILQMIDVIKKMVNIHLVNVVVNMIGVVFLINTEKSFKDVKNFFGENIIFFSNLEMLLYNYIN